ncbi:hypothetical protein ACIRBZ_43730 [Streptomyces sp. NPDC094038]|uniref:hypothetical protein n=1 Tax=Streptomyces sp. NPDC094038 TaxID=3366055 RepID=UPI00380E44C3
MSTDRSPTPSAFSSASLSRYCSRPITRRLSTSSASAKSVRTRTSSASSSSTRTAAAFRRGSRTARIDGIRHPHTIPTGN